MTKVNLSTVSQIAVVVTDGWYVIPEMCNVPLFCEKGEQVLGPTSEICSIYG